MCDRCRELERRPNGSRPHTLATDVAQRVLDAPDEYKKSEQFVTDAYTLAYLVLGDTRMAAYCTGV